MPGKYKMKHSTSIYREREYSCMAGKKNWKIKTVCRSKFKVKQSTRLIHSTVIIANQMEFVKNNISIFNRKFLF